MDSSAYNLTAFNELLHALYEIETAPPGWEIAGELAGTFLGVLQAIADEPPNNDQLKDSYTDLDSTDVNDDTLLFYEHILNNIKVA